jgi:DNA-directed RNA polymerase III subunit RPC3
VPIEFICPAALENPTLRNCTKLRADFFKQLIFSCLSHHGRQPLRKIASYTHLSNTQVEHGLAVLIQHHLIFHCRSLDDGYTYYEADWRAAYRLVRSGKIVQLVEERLGAYAATVLATILFLGHAKISYLESLPELRPRAQLKRHNVPKRNGLNGVHPAEDNAADGEDASHDPENEPADCPNGDRHRASDLQLHAILRSLATHGYIMCVRAAQFQSPEDNYDYAERVVRSRQDIKGLKGKKLREAVDEGVESLIKERTDGTISSALLGAGVPRGVKRRAGHRGPCSPNKRVKLRYVVEADEEAGDGDDSSGDGYVGTIIPMDVSDPIVCHAADS